MSKVFIPAGYHSCLSLYDTQKAISLISGCLRILSAEI